jgi:hypothetical protein
MLFKWTWCLKQFIRSGTFASLFKIEDPHVKNMMTYIKRKAMQCTVQAVKSGNLFDLTACSLVEFYQHIGTTYCYLLQGWRMSHHTAIIFKMGNSFINQHFTLLQFTDFMIQFVDRLCGLVVRVPGYITEMYCVSCEVRTEFIYVM